MGLLPLALAVPAHAAQLLAVVEPKLNVVELVPAEVTLAHTQTVVFSVVGRYEDGSTRDLTSQYTLKVQDADVASFEQATVLRAVGAGRTHVDVLDSRGRRQGEGGDVTVPEITKISIDPATVTLEEGRTRQLRALATLDNGWTAIDITAIVDWTSGKRSVATVGNGDGTAKGLVSALLKGKAEIRAKDPSSGKVSPREEGVVTVVQPGAAPTPIPSPVPTQSPRPGSPTPRPTPTPIPTPSPDPDPGDGSSLRQLLFEPAELRLIPGESVALKVKGIYENGTIADITHLVSFLSRSPRTATVDENGVVTALHGGRTEVEAKDPVSSRASRDDAQILVGTMTEILLSPSAPRLDVGETLQLTALGAFDNGRTAVDVTDRVAWSSGKRSVAGVGTTLDDAGLVTAIAKGQALITARDRISGVASNEIDGTVTVGPAGGGGGSEPDSRLIDIAIDPPSFSLLAGESKPIRGLGVYEDGSILDITAQLEFEVRNGRVARIQTGAVLGIQAGDTAVRAVDLASGRASSIRAPVHVAGVVGLDVLPAGVSTLAFGGTLQLRAIATYDNGATGVDLAGLVEWQIDDPGVASVDGDGVLHAIGPGDVSVRAEDPGSGVRSERKMVMVTVPPGGGPTPTPAPGGDPLDLARLRFDPPTLFLIEGGQGSVRTWGVFGDGHEEDLGARVVYRSRSPRTASVDAAGVVTSVRAGSTEVKVTDSVTGLEDSFGVVVARMTGVVIAPATINMIAGSEVPIRAIATFEGQTSTLDVTGKSLFNSSNKAVAVVEDRADGAVVVRALGRGNSLIQSKHRENGLKSDPSTGLVNVVDTIESVKASPSTRALHVGETTRYKAFGVFEGGVSVEISSSVEWSVENPSIASIDATGRARALALGDTRVIATHPASGKSSADTGSGPILSVVGDLVGLQVGTSSSRFPNTPVEVVLAAGETRELKGLALFAGRTTPFSLNGLEWHSSNPLAVPIDAEGVASCASIGEATISVRDPDTGISSTDTLGDATVICAGEVVGVRVDPSVLELDFGRTRQIRAYRMLENGSESDVTRTVLWSSSDDGILSIVETGSDGGKATGVKLGSVVVSAYDGAFDVSSDDPGGTSAAISVVQIPTSLFIESLDGDLNGHIGETIRLRARVTYRGGATEGVNDIVSWASSAPGVVRMGPDSVNFAHLVGVGTATVTATYPGFPDVKKSVTIQVVP